MADLHACLCRIAGTGTGISLVSIAQEFSPRYERHHDDLVSIDVSGLERLLGTPAVIAAELMRTAADRGATVRVAVARTWIATFVLAQARPGITVVPAGGEQAALSPVPIDMLEAFGPAAEALPVLKQWGLRTLGDLAVLPADGLAARLGQRGRLCQAIARGHEARPLVPDAPEERFDATFDLDWPVEGLEPLSFVLTRLLEPLTDHLARRGRGAAAVSVALHLVTRDSTASPRPLHTRRLDLPSPVCDARTLRTLVLLDLESHPPEAAVDRVTITLEPTPAPVLQHTLFTRAQPTPDEWSTLLARLGALMGQDRIGTPAVIDTHRPGGFALMPFGPPGLDRAAARSAAGGASLRSALRRCRRPVPARVAVDAGRPVHVTTDRQGFSGGRVIASAGPWRTSGGWWEERAGRAGRSGGSGGSGRSGEPGWDRDEWDVAVGDGAVYRVFRERDTNRWFIDAIAD
jgi:protein ImuB